MWLGVGDGSAHVAPLMTIKMQHTNAIRRITDTSFIGMAGVSRE
jgi:hypothetical protein